MNRKIIVTEFVSLDGVFESPGNDGSFRYAGWTMPYTNEEFSKFKWDELFSADALLLGRVTYDIFATAWPTMTDSGEFGDRMNSIPKFVVSTTLKHAEWKNTKIIKKDIVKEIAHLKKQPGRDILVYGSGVLVKTLLQNDLVDQLNLMVYPVVLGEGAKLFDGAERAIFELIDSRSFRTGVVVLRYQPMKK